MPQSARLLVSRALATAIAGPPRLDAFGLTIVRLTVGTIGPLPLASPGLVYRERARRTPPFSRSPTPPVSSPPPGSASSSSGGWPNAS